MRLALYQARSPAGDIPAGLAVIDAALAQSAQAGVDMLTMPELFLPGYNAVTATPPPGWDAVLPQVAGLCRRHGVALTIGLPEYTGRTVYNSAFAFGSDGAVLACYRKVQLFGPREKALFEPGDRLVTFDYKDTRFGLMICYDIEFPEHTRALVRAGAQAILTPTANMKPFLNVNLIQVPGRALENGVTIVYANFTGSERDLDYVGHSIIMGPAGLPIGRADDAEGLVIADLPSGRYDNGAPISTQIADYRPVKGP